MSTGTSYKPVSLTVFVRYRLYCFFNMYLFVHLWPRWSLLWLAGFFQPQRAGGYSLAVVCGLLIAAAPPVAEQGL